MTQGHVTLGKPITTRISRAPGSLGFRPRWATVSICLVGLGGNLRFYQKSLPTVPTAHRESHITIYIRLHYNLPCCVCACVCACALHIVLRFASDIGEIFTSYSPHRGRRNSFQIRSNRLRLKKKLKTIIVQVGSYTNGASPFHGVVYCACSQQLISL
jgi:hypothetical protein